MPLLANYCKKNSSRSRRDNGVEQNCCCDQNKSESDMPISCTKNCSDEPKSKFKYDGVGIMKTFLGPNLEDAVMKTIEFGKSLIQKNDENELAYKEKFIQRQIKKTCKGKTKNHTQKCLEYGFKSRGCGGKKHTDYRQGRKWILFMTQVDKNLPLIRKPPRKLSHLSKIRSLDSDLKTAPHSPEKIKRQLEALIQINKGESERLRDWNLFRKVTTVPVEMTVMPSVCIYNKDADLNSSSCDGQSVEKSSFDQSSSVRERRPRTRLGAPTGICQAPEFLSNALGPTIDVSIIDNLKMMRDIFKSESGRGEGAPVSTGGSKRSSCVSFAHSGTSKPVSGWRQSCTPPPCSKASSKSRESVSCRMVEEEKKIQELQQKQFALQKQIEMEEQERAFRKSAFEEEQRKMWEMKARLQSMDKQINTKDCSTQKSHMNYNSRYEALKQRVACEEEKLSRLKDQYECYRRELYTARSRCEAIRRNKCILDAWDVIASRACHTRLPSFTRAYTLERKEFKANESPGNMHCCFLSPEPFTNESADTPRSSCPKKCKSQNQCGNFSGMFQSKSGESISFEQAKTGLIARGEIPFPIQRDITCGLHQTLRTCCCKSMGKGDAVTCTNDDELLKKCGDGEQENKPACRSKSDTATRTGTCSKIVKVLWAVTRINIFQDNCRTYEVMDATTTPPQRIPGKTEGIFVVRSSQRRRCQESIKRKKCTINFSKK